VFFERHDLSRKKKDSKPLKCLILRRSEENRHSFKNIRRRSAKSAAEFPASEFLVDRPVEKVSLETFRAPVEDL
jgi:hypothetical protein